MGGDSIFTLASLTSLVLFAGSMAFTPGPNNIMVAVSGMNFGYRDTLPHIMGITFGFGVMVIALGVGFGEVFDQVPELRDWLRWPCLVAVLYFSWKIASTRHIAHPTDGTVASGSPLRLWQAALFQWVNGKAWTVIAIVMTNYIVRGSEQDITAFVASIVIVLAVFVPITFVATSIWTLAGSAMFRFFGTPLRLRLFNVFLAVVLLVSILPIVLPDSLVNLLPSL